MRPRGGEESSDSLLDTPDSPMESQTSPLTVITQESSPASPGLDGQPIFSTEPMEEAQDHESCPVEELLSPETQNRKSPGMISRHDINKDEIFIYDESIKYFKAIKESYEDKVGNHELSQAIVEEEPDQRRTSLLELAGVIKNLFKDIEEDDTDERKFALRDLQLHSLPVITSVVEMVRTVASQEDLAILYSVANIKDKLVRKGPDVGKNTARKLNYWTKTMTDVGEAANNYLYEQLKMDPTSKANETIQVAKEAVAVLMKENVMLKNQLRTMEEGETIYKETTVNQLTSVGGGVQRQEERMKNLENLLQAWTNRNPKVQYNEVAAGFSDWWTDQPSKKSKTEPVIPEPKGHQTQNPQQVPLQALQLGPPQQVPLQAVQQQVPPQALQQGPLQQVPIQPVQQQVPPQALQQQGLFQQIPTLASQCGPSPPEYGGQPGPVPHGPAWDHHGQVHHGDHGKAASGLRQGGAPNVQQGAAQGPQYGTLQAPQKDPTPRASAPSEAQRPGPPPTQWMTPEKMIQNLKIFPMTAAEARDEATLIKSIAHLARVEEIVDRIKSDLKEKHPEYMAELQNWYPSDTIQHTYHYVSYQLSIKRSLIGLHRFLNSQTTANYDEKAAKFRFPLLRPGSRYQRGIHDHNSHKMKSENNQQLIALYCPTLAHAIFVTEKVFQKKGHNRFWVDPKEGTSESMSSLSMMILILNRY